MTSQAVHITDMLSFKTCRRRWNWSSRMRMNLEPRAPHAPFLTGSAAHYMLEKKYSKVPMTIGASLAQFIADNETLPKYFEHTDLALGLMEHYERWTKRQRGAWSDDDLEFLDVEHKFTVPLTEPATGLPSDKVHLEGKWDGIVRRKTDKTLWLKEYKTAARIEDKLSSLPIDEQATAYLMAANKLMDEPVVGIIYTIIRKKLPKEPAVLRSGMLSQSMHKDITFESYLNAIYRHHGQVERAWIEAQYGEILDELSRMPNQYFTRVVVTRSEQELRAAERDIYDAAIDMISNPAVYLHAGWHCRFCYFKDPCLTYHTPESERILAEQYRIRIVDDEEVLAVEE